MKLSEFKSLGNTKQLKYVNRLENLNQQLKDLVKSLEIENKELLKLADKSTKDII